MSGLIRNLLLMLADAGCVGGCWLVSVLVNRSSGVILPGWLDCGCGVDGGAELNENGGGHIVRLLGSGAIYCKTRLSTRTIVFSRPFNINRQEELR